MDGYLKENLDIIKNKIIPNKWDFLGIVFGYVGAGKSTLCSQLCKYLDDDFNIKKCVFTPAQFDDAIEGCKPGSAIQWDEAITGVNVAQHASQTQVSIRSKLTQIRKKNLQMFLLAPELDAFNKYFVSRCTFGIYVYAKDWDDRGYALFFDETKMKHIYYLMKEKYKANPYQAISVVRSNFWFAFPNKFMLPEKEYDNKKEMARTEMEKNNSANIWRDRCFSTVDKLVESGMTKVAIAEMWGIQPQSLHKAIKSYKPT